MTKVILSAQNLPKAVGTDWFPVRYVKCKLAVKKC